MKRHAHLEELVGGFGHEPSARLLLVGGRGLDGEQELVEMAGVVAEEEVEQPSKRPQVLDERG